MSALAPLSSRLPFAREAGERDDGPLLLGLHGEGHQIGELVAFLRGLTPARELVAPVGAWGTYVGAMDLSSYTWFHQVPGVAEPEPISFGRSLMDIEQLLLARSAGSEEAGAVIVGAGQGATLALALTAVVPHLLRAVVAIGGRPATLPAGAVLDAPAAAPVPVLWLAGPSAAAGEEAAAGAALGAGVTLTVQQRSGDDPLAPATREHVAAWLASELDADD